MTTRYTWAKPEADARTDGAADAVEGGEADEAEADADEAEADEAEADEAGGVPVRAPSGPHAVTTSASTASSAAPRRRLIGLQCRARS
jgi:hypothetical protein